MEEYVRTWLPHTGKPSGAEGAPVVVLGHGGGRSKDAEEIAAVAGAFRKRGCAVIAGDWPGHGRHAEDPDAPAETILHDSAQLICDPEAWATSTKEWSVALDDFVEAFSLGPVGYWGLSLGTVFGVGVAAHVRPHAAVFGLAGTVPSLAGAMLPAAAGLTCPVRFLHQTDDELFPAAAISDLHSTLGSEEVDVRSNPGGHFDVPLQEILASVMWLSKKLVSD